MGLQSLTTHRSATGINCIRNPFCGGGSGQNQTKRELAWQNVLDSFLTPLAFQDQPPFVTTTTHSPAVLTTSPILFPGSSGSASMGKSLVIPPSQYTWPRYATGSIRPGTPMLILTATRT